MFRFLLCFCCLSLSVALPAQDYITDFDDFASLKGGWTGFRSQSLHISQQAGALKVHNKSRQRELLTQEVLIYNRGTFTLETSATFTDENPQAIIGLVWSADRLHTRYYALEVQADGYFRIIEVEDGAEKTWLDWTKTRRLKKTGESNIISLQKKGFKVYASINGKEVGQAPHRSMRDKYQGILVGPRSSFTAQSYSLRHLDLIIQVASEKFQFARKTPLDSTINSPLAHESAPVLSPDRKSLYFTRAEVREGSDPGDIWRSQVQGDSMWGPPLRLPAPLNNADRNAVVQMKGENRFWLASDYFEDGSANGNGISFSRKEDLGKWEVPVSFAIPDLISTGAWGTYAFNLDENILVLAMEGEDSYGGLDLYVSFLKKGRWTRPENLGPTVNTFGDESCPFIDKDNMRLFFSSTGHPGFGQADVYYTDRSSQTWTQWERPLNLGEMINSPGWDGFFYPFHELHAYMASSDSTRGDLDLYGVRYYRPVKTVPLLGIKGIVLNQKTGEPLPATVWYERLTGTAPAEKVATQGQSGRFALRIPYGHTYRLYPILTGYYPQTDTLDLQMVRTSRLIERTLYMRPIEVGQTIPLDRVFFQRAKDELLPTSYPELDQLVQVMRNMPTLVIQIRGHTDNVGPEYDLQILSEARAERVKRYLLDGGISPYRVLTVGLGSAEPIADNADPITRRLNRRVEFRVMRQ
ncbi:MAG: OmpA family protein [Bacteroidota bacterium]